VRKRASRLARDLVVSPTAVSSARGARTLPLALPAEPHALPSASARRLANLATRVLFAATVLLTLAAPWVADGRLG